MMYNGFSNHQGAGKGLARGYGLNFPSPLLLNTGGERGDGFSARAGRGEEKALAAPNRFSARTATIDGAGYSLRRNLR